MTDTRLKSAVRYLVGAAAAFAVVAAGIIPAAAAESGPEGTTPEQTVGIPAQQQLQKEGKESPIKEFNAESGDLVVNADWAKDNKVASGTVVAAGSEERFPNGLMRFVEGVKENGDTVTLTTRAARLNEALAGVDDKDRNAVEGKVLEGESLGVKGSVADKQIADAVVADNPGTKVVDSNKDDKAVDVTGDNNADKTAVQPRMNTVVTPSVGDVLKGININKPFGKEFKFEFDRTINKDSCSNGTFDYGVDPSLKTAPSDCSWEGDGSLHARFALKAFANGGLVVKTEGLKIQEVSFKGGAGVTGETKMETNGKLTGHMTWTIADLTFPFTIPAGPVPITINVKVKPTVTLFVDSEGNAKASLGGLEASYKDIGVQFSTPGGVANGGKGGFEFLKGKPTMNIAKPELTGQTDLLTTVGINPNVAVDFMGIIGVKVNVGLHANADFAISQTTPICMLGFGMQGTVGLSDLKLVNIPTIGFLFGGVQDQIDKFVAEKATYNWNVPSLYTSPNMCANSPISIGDKVWYDANGNGLQDNYKDASGKEVPEPGLAGATVTLVRSIDKNVVDKPDSPLFKSLVVAQVVTGADGSYKFDSDPSFKGVALGVNKGKYAGKLMPGEYTVVVKPPYPGDKGYAYKDIAPYGFKATKAYQKVDGKLVGKHGLEDLSKDSGGKYAWNTDSYNALFDGTRFQDESPASMTQVVDNKTEPGMAVATRKAQLNQWRAELNATGGYNDTVDFGFVPRTDQKVGVSGKVYAAADLGGIGDAKVFAPGVHVSNVQGAVPGKWVWGAVVRLTPLDRDDVKPVEVKTAVAGRFKAMVPEGKYRVEVVSVPNGYSLPSDYSYVTEVNAYEENSTWGLIPGDNWVNFGVEKAK